MNNRKGFTKQEWSVILPFKQDIRKELCQVGFNWKTIRKEAKKLLKYNKEK